MSFRRAALRKGQRAAVEASCGPWAVRPRPPRFRNGRRNPSGTASARGYFLARPKTNGRGPSGETAPAPGRGLATRPRHIFSSAVVDVDVDLVGNADVRAVPESEVGTEDVQQHQHDDDQQDDGKDGAASATAACLDHSRMFAL